MTTSVVSEEKPNPLRVALAWGVHLFTASGAVWGFLAMLAIFEHDWRRDDPVDDRCHVRGWL